MFRKLILVLLAVLMFSMTACGNNTPTEPEQTAEPVETVAVTLSPEVTEEPENSPLPGGVHELTEEEKKEFEKDAEKQAQITPKPDATGKPENPDAEQSQGVDLNIASPNGSTEYEKYQAMSGEEQQAFFESFDDPAAFFAWLNNARAEFEAMYPGIDVGDGEIDLNDYIVSGN